MKTIKLVDNDKKKSLKSQDNALRYRRWSEIKLRIFIYRYFVNYITQK